MKNKNKLKQVLVNTLITDSGCISFQGKLRNDGYGHIQVDNVSIYLHRFVYEQQIGKIPKNMSLDHLCRNKQCINIKHLEVVTNKINVLRGIGPTAINARKTHCNNDHLLEGNNLRIENTGSRRCLQCKNNYDKHYYKNITMNKNKQIVRHGDIGIRPLEMTSLKTLPKEVKIQDGKVVAHGESGNKHMIQQGQVLVLESPIKMQIPSGTYQVEKFLHISQDTVITHEEHPTLPIPAGDYAVLQEREMDHMAEVERTVMD